MSVTSDYIKLTDALALAEELYVGDAPVIAVSYNDIQSLLKAFFRQLPSAQPEIVRCKDCKHFEREMLYCDDLGFMCREDDFCSYAERRNDGEIH